MAVNKQPLYHSNTIVRQREWSSLDHSEQFRRERHIQRRLLTFRTAAVEVFRNGMNLIRVVLWVWWGWLENCTAKTMIYYRAVQTDKNLADNVQCCNLIPEQVKCSSRLDCTTDWNMEILRSPCFEIKAHISERNILGTDNKNIVCLLQSLCHFLTNETPCQNRSFN